MKMIEVGMHRHITPLVERSRDICKGAFSEYLQNHVIGGGDVNAHCISPGFNLKVFMALLSEKESRDLYEEMTPSDKEDFSEEFSKVVFGLVSDEVDKVYNTLFKKVRRHNVKRGRGKSRGTDKGS